LLWAGLFLFGAMIGLGRAAVKRRGSLTVGQGIGAALLGGVAAVLLLLLYFLSSAVLYRLVVGGG